MNFAHFTRIEQEVGGQHRLFVVHTQHPRFAVEFTLCAEGGGTDLIKRICIPNSCVGDYGIYAKFIAAAQEFLRQSVATPPVSKAETARYRAS